jgi:hypothetical protein
MKSLSYGNTYHLRMDAARRGKLLREGEQFVITAWNDGDMVSHFQKFPDARFVPQAIYGFRVKSVKNVPPVIKQNKFRAFQNTEVL